jgi:hypothetical protein
LFNCWLSWRRTPACYCALCEHNWAPGTFRDKVWAPAGLRAHFLCKVARQCRVRGLGRKSFSSSYHWHPSKLHPSKLQPLRRSRVENQREGCYVMPPRSLLLSLMLATAFVNEELTHTKIADWRRPSWSTSRSSTRPSKKAARRALYQSLAACMQGGGGRTKSPG